MRFGKNTIEILLIRYERVCDIFAKYFALLTVPSMFKGLFTCIGAQIVLYFGESPHRTLNKRMSLSGLSR